MGSVVVTSVGSARHDDTDGRLLHLHCPNLDRARVSTEHHALTIFFRVQVKSVVFLPGRMIEWDVELSLIHISEPTRRS